MKILRSFTVGLAILFLTADILLLVTGNEHLFKAVANTYLVGVTGPTIEEHEIFENRLVEAGEHKQLPFSSSYNEFKEDKEILANIEKYQPAALLVMKKGEIIYERYFDQFNPESYSNSFSVAKSIVGLSIGICIDQGLIKNVDQPVIDFVPELKGTYREDLLIKHLLSMTSGMNFDESYGDPFGFMAKAYYGDELLKKTLSYSVEEKPGANWKYLGGNTILLSIIVERVSKQSLSDFVSTHLWKPLGASQPAIWNLDEKNGIEKAYCCFYSNARDFARFGMLVLNEGKVWGRQIMSSDYLHSMSEPVLLNDGTEIPHYGWQWWRVKSGSDQLVYARGILGQYIIVWPEEEVVIVRLGHQRGEKNEDQQPADLFEYIALAKSLLNQLPVVGE